jgi:hypothetical protein
MVIDDKILDQLIDFVESNKKFNIQNPSVRAGVYKGYHIRVVLDDPVEEEKK